MHYLLRLAVLTFIAFGQINSAKAWDQHHLVTRAVLDGVVRDSAVAPAFRTQLGAPILVTPFEQFVQKAFAQSCDASRVMDGVGATYQMLYIQGAIPNLDMDWENGISRLTLTQERNPRFEVGSRLTPLDILSVYSDEPDWGMDDQVARLMNAGVSGAQGVNEGIATRVLRHFWYEGESLMGVDFGKDQELDRRAQLFYELSLKAFEVGEPYWGYRFLASCLHYIEDLYQPFHVKAVMNDEMIFKLDTLFGAVCEFNRSNPNYRPSPTCTPQETIRVHTIRSAWLTGMYHGIYEDFARGLIARGKFATRPYLMSIHDTARNQDLAQWQLNQSNAFRPLVQTIQARVKPYARNLGRDLVKFLDGNRRFRFDPALQQREIMAVGHDHSHGYQKAIIGYYDDDLSSNQKDARARIIQTTHTLFTELARQVRGVVIGTWTQVQTGFVLNNWNQHQARCQ